MNCSGIRHGGCVDAGKQVPDPVLHRLDLLGVVAHVTQLPFQEGAQGGQVIGRGLQRGTDIRQRESEHLERPDPVQPPHVLPGVAAVAGSRPPAG